MYHNTDFLKFNRYYNTDIYKQNYYVKLQNTWWRHISL